MQFIICLYYFTCVIEYVHCNYFIKRFRGLLVFVPDLYEIILLGDRGTSV